MSFETLIGMVQRLGASVEVLAAIGGELNLRRTGLDADPEMRQRLADVVRGIDPTLLDGVGPDQEAIALAAIQSTFRLAVDLLDQPARAPGWAFDDHGTLQAMGQMSRRIIRSIDAFAEQRPNLRSVLAQPGKFLDIGTGVGWLAIEAARTWPAMDVVGIDIWEPSLELARANVVQNELEHRVELRAQDVATIDANEALTVGWVPGPFLPRDVVTTALANLRQALLPGGWLVFGTFPAPPDPVGQMLTALKIVRSGGHPWTTAEMEQQLHTLGFEEVETFAPGAIVVLVVGRKPAA